MRPAEIQQIIHVGNGWQWLIYFADGTTITGNEPTFDAAWSSCGQALAAPSGAMLGRFDASTSMSGRIRVRHRLSGRLDAVAGPP
jgi:hypothetical protein